MNDQLTSIKSPSFYIKDIAIPHYAALAPMDGFSDQPFRQLTREMGSALTISEFINAIDIEHGHKFLRNRIAFTSAERPFGYQLLDNDIARLVRGAIFLEAHKPDFIDLNFGCPSKQVTHRGAGSAILLQPKLVKEIIIEIVKNVQIPVTAKIRLGWDESTINYLEICKIIEDNGCSMISVHARTKVQAYKGLADWSAIERIKNVVKIPVLGNGDIRSVVDIHKMRNSTGCDGVLIGRGAVQNPWIFKELELYEVSVLEVYRFYSTLLQKVIEFYDSKVAPKIFRKYIVKLLDNYSTVSRNERIEILTTNSIEIILDLLDKIIKQHHCLLPQKGNNDKSFN